MIYNKHKPSILDKKHLALDHSFNNNHFFEQASLSSFFQTICFVYKIC